MHRKTLLKLTAAFLSITILSGCVAHGRHHIGLPHASVHVDGHVHGKPAQVLGALAVGAVIGHALHAAAHRKHHERDGSPQVEPGDNYYLKTLEGDCLWVEVDEQGHERRTQIESEYCD